jgi:hypothetical protein
MTFQTNTSTPTPRMNDPIVDTMFSVPKSSLAR